MDLEGKSWDTTTVRIFGFLIQSTHARLCVCLCVCVCVCVYMITQKIMKLEHIVIYENSSDEFDIGHCPVKVKA